MSECEGHPHVAQAPVVALAQGTHTAKGWSMNHSQGSTVRGGGPGPGQRIFMFDACI